MSPTTAQQGHTEHSQVTNFHLVDLAYLAEKTSLLKEKRSRQIHMHNNFHHMLGTQGVKYQERKGAQ